MLALVTQCAPPLVRVAESKNASFWEQKIGAGELSCSWGGAYSTCRWRSIPGNETGLWWNADCHNRCGCVCLCERKIAQEKWSVCVLGRDRKRERGRKKYGETEREVQYLMLQNSLVTVLLCLWTGRRSHPAHSAPE